MMKLRFSPSSPYVRKVSVLALETGLDDKLDRVTTPTTPENPNPELGKENPLNKIPCLLTDDGLVLYDSPGRRGRPSGGRRLPAGGERRRP